MRLSFHIFFFLLLLQDAFIIGDDFSNARASLFLNSEKENGNINYPSVKHISNGLFYYFSCFLDKIFSKKLIKQAEQELLDFKNNEEKKIKKGLAKVIRSESNKLKKEADKQFKRWDNLLEKSVTEQIYKMDKFSKDQIELMKQKGDYLLSTNIFNFSQKNEGTEKEEMKTGDKQKTTERRGFWPFTSSSNTNEEEQKEQQLKEEQHSFLHFFKFGKKEEETEKEKEEESSEIEQNKNEQRGVFPWWFSNTKKEQLKKDELMNPTGTKEKNDSSKNSFFGLFKSNEVSDVTSETEKKKEDESTQRKWYHIFSKGNTEEEPDMYETNILRKQEQEQQQQQPSWWSKTFGKDARKTEEINSNINEELQGSEEQGKQKKYWWNFKKTFPTNDMQIEKKKDNDIDPKMNSENELREKKENESVFNMWGYGRHQVTEKSEEEEEGEEEEEEREKVKETIESSDKINNYEEREKTWASSIFDMSSQENTNKAKFKEYEEEKEKAEEGGGGGGEEEEVETEAEKNKNQIKDIIEADDYEKQREGVSSLFRFNESKPIEDKNIQEKEEIASIPDTHARLNFIEKIYNFNLDDMQDEQFISFFTEKYEGESNVNCHPLIVFKVCVYKCFKSLTLNDNSKNTNAAGTQDVGTNKGGLNAVEYKQLEKCILKCKKLSFDTVHGGCIQKNGKVVNKKENYIEYLDELETHNLHLTNNPTVFSDFSLKDKYAQMKINQKEKPVQQNIIQNKLLQKNKLGNFASAVWNIGKKELNLQMFNKNNKRMSHSFQNALDNTSKTNRSVSSVRNRISLMSSTENDNSDRKGLYETSMNFFNPFKKKDMTNKETEQNEEMRTAMKEEKIEFLNNDTYTVSDDKIDHELYARSNSYMSTIFFLILIVLAVCIYFSVFTSIISQFFSACTEEISTFIRDSYKTTFVNIPNTPTEYFLPKNEKKNISSSTVHVENNITDGFYVSANEINPIMERSTLNTSGYPLYSYPPDQV